MAGRPRDVGRQHADERAGRVAAIQALAAGQRALSKVSADVLRMKLDAHHAGVKLGNDTENLDAARTLMLDAADLLHTVALHVLDAARKESPKGS
jgi:hypothetical protein